MVRVTGVITKPSKDKCDRGAMWESRQPLTAGEASCFHLMFSALPWCSNAVKHLPSLDSCRKDSTSGSKSNPIIYTNYSLGPLSSFSRECPFWLLLTKPFMN